MVVLAKESWNYLFVVSWESEWQESFDLMQGHHLDGEVVTPWNEKSWIIGPGDSNDVFRMKIAILFVQNHRRELLKCNRGCFEDFKSFACGYSEEFRIRWELNSSNMVSKVKVSNYYLFGVVYDQSKPINVNSNKGRSIRREHQSINVTPILEWQSPRNIAAQKESVKI